MIEISGYLRKPHAVELVAIGCVVALLQCSTAVASTDNMNGDTAAVAAVLGLVRKVSSGIDHVGVGDVISIDFDIPRYGPICISVNENDGLEFVWEEYHNLHQLPDEDSFRDCDFSHAMALVPQGLPNPQGYEVEAAATTTARYFSCSKICASNGHKIKVCAGGDLGQENECFATAECEPDRTIDMRTIQSVASPLEESRDGYVPVGKVCRPKNGEGYSVTSGVDTPASCRQKCDEDSERCGAWEFEDYAADNKECELHEFDVISYEETLAMGECLMGQPGNDDGDYRCCWIAEEIVELQTGGNLTDIEDEMYSSGCLELRAGSKYVGFSVTMTIASLLMSYASFFKGS